MRIGLYGMPSAGKTFIMERIDFMETVSGSGSLRKYYPNFDELDGKGREKCRENLANVMMSKTDFIMDGHYSFGDEIVFTENDGKLYDVFLYIFIDPNTLKIRMENSEKNKKYLKYNIEAWQEKEIEELREYCHLHDKDFYVIDSPPENTINDISNVLEFIKDIRNGYSCVNFAKRCVEEILAKNNSNVITLYDGDKTLTIEDTSNKVFGYKTHIYDGNYYTGYQAWKQAIEFKNYSIPKIKKIPVNMNQDVLSTIDLNSYILTSGHELIWSFIASQLKLEYFCGLEMSAETKFFIAKFLRKSGKVINAYGDGMNDYYMLKEADKGYLVLKQDGTVSKSLRDKDLEGLICLS